jgi:CBS domain containing-hemolysin-like protein
MLTTILVGNNAVNTFTAVAATAMAQVLLDSSVLALVTAATTIALLVFGEITPKTFAKANAERLAPISITVVAVLYYAMFPIVFVFSTLSRLLVELFGGTVSRTGPFVTEDDIAYMVQLGQQEGVIAEHEEKLITSVLEFGDTVVKEVMVPRTKILAIPMAASLDELVKAVRDGGHSRMPVYGESLDDIRGFFHAKELLEVLADLTPNAAKTFDVKKHMYEPFFVPELMKISALMKEFQRRKTHIAVVVDEYGGTSGIISLEDVIEEIVGPIDDEYDEDQEADVKRVADGRFMVAGKTPIYELTERTGIKVPADEGFETVGGFFIARHGRLPSPGDELVHEGWRFVVTASDDKRIDRLDVVRMASLVGLGGRGADAKAPVDSKPPTEAETSDKQRVA